MRHVFGSVASWILRTRYGVALLLAVVVAGAVGVAKLAGGGDDPAAGLLPPPGLPSTVDPSAGDDGEGPGLPTPTPVTSPGAAPPERVAASAAAAWVNHRNTTASAWLARLRPHLTDGLADRLVDVDPAGVPADRITGPVRLTPRGDSLVEAAIPVDSGTLRLRLVAAKGRWLVDWLDWERTG